jgi:dihydroxyacetone kinase
MGLALTACTVPAAGRPSFDLAGDEMEWGLGIHGEPGVRRSALRPASEIVAGLVARIVEDRGITAGRPVALLVNGLGATPPAELSIVAGAAVRELRDRDVPVLRAWTGTFLSALDMAGCSISLLPVDDDLIAALDAPTTAPAWPGPGLVPDAPATVAAPAANDEPADGGPAPGGGLTPDAPLRRALEAAARALTAAEPELTALDREVGDGDLGTSLARGAAAVLAGLDRYPGDDAAALRAASAAVRRSVGGTSGPLYAVMLLRAAAALEHTPGDWAGALTAAVDGVRDVGGADVGDRTMVDALAPAAAALAGTGDVSEAVAAAERGAAGTAGVRARLGRSSYLGDRVLGHEDPGARAVVVWLAAVAGALDGRI